MFGSKWVVSVLTLFCVSLVSAAGDQQFAAIGDLKLQSGATLKACRVGYRTFGTLNSKKNNVVLVPTWFLGKSGDLAGSFGPGGLADSAKYYVIAVDALSNGVSTSPSNSPDQHDADFPTITIRDMVESQHQLLLKLGITHLHAVMGVSMGGIQTFQWITAYPDFVDLAVPIVGSPRPTSYDLMFYLGGLKAVQAAIANPSARTALIRAFADFFWLSLNTPAYYVQHTKREDALSSLSGFEGSLLAWDPYDIAAGLSALSTQDIYKPFGSIEKAATAVRAKVFVVVAGQDHCVNPAPALEFAQALHAQTLIFPGDEGHSSPFANMGRLGPAIAKFLGN